MLSLNYREVICFFTILSCVTVVRNVALGKTIVTRTQIKRDCSMIMSKIRVKDPGDQYETALHKWVKVFKNGPSKICGRQPLKYLK